MASTNETPNIKLPQFIGTDIPTWLGDYNGAMKKIDDSVGQTKAELNALDVPDYSDSTKTTFSPNTLELEIDGVWVSASNVTNAFVYENNKHKADYTTFYGEAVHENSLASVKNITGARLNLLNIKSVNGFLTNIKPACLCFTAEFDASPEAQVYDMQDIFTLYYDTKIDEVNNRIRLVDGNGKPNFILPIPKFVNNHNGKITFQFTGNTLYKK